MVAKEFWKGDSVSFSFFLLCPTLTLTHYFTYHSYSILVRLARAVTRGGCKLERGLGRGGARENNKAAESLPTY
jgi:hypothetical protein